MRDPELVARAQHAAARLESAWERWRALQGIGETPAQPVVGYVGYALKEPWGQPRAVIGFSADEAERLADFLERGNSDYAAVERTAHDRGAQDRNGIDRGALDRGPHDLGALDHRAADRGREPGQRHTPDQPAAPMPSVAPAVQPDIMAVTSQLSGFQLGHSFL
jgi:hypothetical protein